MVDCVTWEDNLVAFRAGGLILVTLFRRRWEKNTQQHLEITADFFFGREHRDVLQN
jgi:hypothetical protein